MKNAWKWSNWSNWAYSNAWRSSHETKLDKCVYLRAWRLQHIPHFFRGGGRGVILTPVNSLIWVIAFLKQQKDYRRILKQQSRSETSLIAMTIFGIENWVDAESIHGIFDKRDISKTTFAYQVTGIEELLIGWEMIFNGNDLCNDKRTHYATSLNNTAKSLSIDCFWVLGSSCVHLIFSIMYDDSFHQHIFHCS